jgi:excisionase family DNA binding protein
MSLAPWSIWTSGHRSPEAASILGISKDLAYDLARRGELPGAFQLGRRWRVSLIKLRAAVHGTEDGSTQHAR